MLRPWEEWVVWEEWGCTSIDFTHKKDRMNRSFLCHLFMAEAVNPMIPVGTS